MLQAVQGLPLLAAPTVLLAAVVVYRAARAWAARRRILRLGGYAPQIPTALPWGIGILFNVLRNTLQHQTLRCWTQWLDNTPNHGTVEAHILSRRCVFTADPDNIKAVLATQFDDFGKGDDFHATWRRFLGDSIFTTDGRQWAASRQLIRPMFVKDRVSDLQVMERHVQRLLAAMVIEEEDGPQRIVNMSDLIFRYSLDVATDFLLGDAVGSLETPAQGFETAFEHVQHIQALIVRMGRAHILIPRGSFNRSIRSIDAFVRPYIDSALRIKDSNNMTTKSEPDYTFLHALSHHTRDPQLIRDQLISILIAGRDTTASALSWTVYELARHPEVVTRVRKEILDMVGLDCPTYSQLKEMKYLQNILRETLRLYPIIPSNVRVALRDTHLPRGGGPDGLSPIGILKNTQIFYSPLYLHRRDEFYPPGCSDHLHFRPERWETWQPRPWTYLPFNGGPRVCIGQQFALTEMAYTLVRLLQRFERMENWAVGETPVLATNISVRPGED
ncbi:hypothetical protein FE257_006775 [Aspergillus nanangensis]|uniref:Cytochrome P450 alkane hydroxylase n=1 Tax=Aspergillus nanangensis TaxID=2582783 RepID=A0AAD4GVW6_ASPNN|nr:hypothetical protein FE257_006775 [Aspergillus nanangensis]